VPMKWPAKVLLVIAVLVGIHCGAEAKDRDRWMAALGLSTTSASKLRVENEREKYLAQRAAEEARWHGADKVASDVDAAPTAAATLNRDVVCAGAQEREALLKSSGQELDRKLERTKLLCSHL
jgi:hypothetical protein